MCYSSTRYFCYFIFVIYDIIRRRHIQKSEQTEAAALMAEIERLKSEKAKLESESKN